jgi:hypothetical protein
MDLLALILTVAALVMFLFAASGRELRRFNEIALGLVFLSAALICQFTAITNTHIGRKAAASPTPPRWRSSPRMTGRQPEAHRDLPSEDGVGRAGDMAAARAVAPGPHGTAWPTESLLDSVGVFTPERFRSAQRGNVWVS